MSNPTTDYKILQVMSAHDPIGSWTADIFVEGGDPQTLNLIGLVEHTVDGVEVREVVGMIYQDAEYMPMIPATGWNNYTLLWASRA